VWKIWLDHSISACYRPVSDGIASLVRNYYRTAVEKWVLGAERRQDGESYLQFRIFVREVKSNSVEPS